ncbi:hypothetical protein [Deinococcus multiflagellatus]|uniref:Uncharacterized protein n=1 Tax=Deinococcus multiflagellatus TaxID=1656887 RepID=A0ABW1ZSL8_9DEIO
MAQAATQPTPAPSSTPAYIGPNITRQYYSQDLMTKYGALDMTQDSLWTLEFPSAVTDIYYTRDDMISAKIVGNTVVIAALAKTGTLPIAVMLEGGRKQFFKATFKADAPTVKLIRIIDRDLPAKAAPTSEEEPERPVDLASPTSVAPAAPEGVTPPEPRPPLAVSPLVERRLAVQEAPAPEPAVLAAQPPLTTPVEAQVAAAPRADAPMVALAAEPVAAPPLTASAPVVTEPAPAAATPAPAVAAPAAVAAVPAPAAPVAPRVEAPRPAAATPRPAPMPVATPPVSAPAPAARQTQAPAPLLALKAAPSPKAPTQAQATPSTPVAAPPLSRPPCPSPSRSARRRLWPLHLSPRRQRPSRRRWLSRRPHFQTLCPLHWVGTRRPALHLY